MKKAREAGKDDEIMRGKVLERNDKEKMKRKHRYRKIAQDARTYQ